MLTEMQNWLHETFMMFLSFPMSRLGVNSVLLGGQ